MKNKNFKIDEIVNYVMEENGIPNIRLQKYYKLKWFFSALKKDIFTFQKPVTWHDPFEDFLSKLANNRQNSVVNGFQITGHIYAMSTISRRSESDGMWRNFADNNGVLIYTSSKKIIRSVVTHLFNNGCFNNKNTFHNDSDIKQQMVNTLKLRKIKYISDVGISDFFKNATQSTNADIEELAYKGLSIKRIEYNYESEFRVFLIPSFVNLEEDKYLSISYFHDAITKIILSPTADATRVNRIVSVLTKKYNIKNSQIEQSKLYDINYFKNKHGL